MTVALIWAQANGGVIGRDNTIPWHVPEDSRRFRDLTRGHRVVMGRRTWESLPERFRPLPDRVNVVLTTDHSWRADGAVPARDLESALALESASALEYPLALESALVTDADDTVMVMGGSEVYIAAMPFATLLHVTEIDLDVDGADALAPPIDPRRWTVTTAGDWQLSRTGVRYRFLDYGADPAAGGDASPPDR